MNILHKDPLVLIEFIKVNQKINNWKIFDYIHETIKRTRYVIIQKGLFLP